LVMPRLRAAPAYRGSRGNSNQESGFGTTEVQTMCPMMRTELGCGATLLRKI
jgi:hypothetical protein